MTELQILYLLGIPLSFVLISEGADWMTDGAAFLSKKWKITRTALGTVFVSVFTGLPELIIALLAIYHKSEGIVLGNILGANIASIAIIVGACAFIKTLRTPRRVIVRDGVFLLAATLAACATMIDGKIAKTEGLILLAMYVPYVINLYEMERIEEKYEHEEETKVLDVQLELLGKIIGKDVKIKNPYLAFFMGTGLLVLSGELLLRGALSLAAVTGIPEVFIGLTVVAIGTSVPDVVAAVNATRKGYDDLAVSEAIGANLFGTMVILGTVALIAPDGLSINGGGNLIFVSIGALLLITAALLIAMIRGRRIDRKEASVLIAIYTIYLLVAALMI
ncbi:MAG: sodium:calcium antiporter [Candidatus Thermoplasmatota archaeon]|nr:sodium:calcium antiporter [Candidatus Thermoplasmatota archaeon]